MDSDKLSAERYTLEEAVRELRSSTEKEISPRKLLELGSLGYVAIAVWSNASECWCYLPKEELLRFELKETHRTSTLGFHSTPQQFYNDSYDGPIVGGGSEIIGISDLRIFDSDLTRLDQKLQKDHPAYATPNQVKDPLGQKPSIAQQAFGAIQQTPLAKIEDHLERTHQQLQQSCQNGINPSDSPLPVTQQKNVAIADELTLREERLAKGRYTLEEAAESIAMETGERQKQILTLLSEAVANEEIKRYIRQSDITCPKFWKLRDYHDEVFWDDLNNWLSSSLPRLRFRFPQPANPTQKQPSQLKPSKLRSQEEAIINAIKKLGHSPDALPPHVTGKAGIKAAVRASMKDDPLFKGKTVFDATWERLRKFGEIQESK